MKRVLLSGKAYDLQSTTELRQPDNHQPSQSSIYAARESNPGHLVAAGLFTSLYFRLLTSKSSLFQQEARVLSV